MGDCVLRAKWTAYFTIKLGRYSGGAVRLNVMDQSLGKPKRAFPANCMDFKNTEGPRTKMLSVKSQYIVAIARLKRLVIHLAN
jgi:hypothetical protein